MPRVLTCLNPFAKQKMQAWNNVNGLINELTNELTNMWINVFFNVQVVFFHFLWPGWGCQCCATGARDWPWWLSVFWSKRMSLTGLTLHSLHSPCVKLKWHWSQFFAVKKKLCAFLHFCCLKPSHVFTFLRMACCLSCVSSRVSSLFFFRFTSFLSSLDFSLRLEMPLLSLENITLSSARHVTISPHDPGKVILYPWMIHAILKEQRRKLHCRCMQNL